MTEKVFIIVSTIIIALNIFLIYKVGDLSMKLRRIRRRYDILLRGNEDINLEELLNEYSEDIDKSVKGLNILDIRLKKLDNEIFQKIDKLEKEMINRDKKDSEEINTRMNIDNQLVKDKITSLDSNINNKLDKSIVILKEAIDELDSREEKNFRSLDGKFSSEYSSLIEDINIYRSKLEHEIKVENEKIFDKIDKETKLLDDKLSLSIQQIALHRYDALDNQTGSLSFSLVLLDRHNTGIILTSINGRESSYTYSKNIKDGKPLVELSPEEKIALSKVI